MLSEFLIRLPAFGGEVRCADIPAAVFFDGHPDDLPFTDCWNAGDWSYQRAVVVGNQQWITAMLARAVVEPALTPETVNRLGGDREVLARGYFETVGWTPRDPDQIPVDVRPAPRGTGRRRAFTFASLTALPGKNIRGHLKLMAMRTRTQPAALWALPISEWIFNMRLLADPQVAPEDVFGLS